MSIKINIEPLSTEAGKKLQSFKDKVVDKKKFELETSLKKDDKVYRNKEAVYKSYLEFYELMNNLNMEHITMVESFKIIMEKLIDIHFKESVNTGRLLPSQIKEFEEIWVLMNELYNFFNK